MNAYERLIDALREHGCQVIDNGHGSARAQCPAHDDTNPSLSLKAIDGRVLLYCHACGHSGTPDIAAALGLAMADLFDDRRGRDYRYPGGLIVSRYYCKGSSSKHFAQKGDKTDRSLYGAQHITPDTKVIVAVEGEQDVDAARSIGVIAVSAKGGAGKAAKSDWSPCHGYPVLVVADKDEPGRAHAADVAAILDGHVPALRIFEPAQGCKDLADHIAAGFGLHELVPLAEAARNGAELGDEFVTVTLSAVTPEPVTWLWPDRLPAAKLVNLDGDPGLGKSTLALTFAAIVSTGGLWPDGTVCEYPGDVVLLSAEDGIADTIVPRADAAGAKLTRIHAVQGVPIPGEDHALRLPTLADIAQLRRLVEATAARLVIVDVLMAYLPGGTDSHKDQDIRAVLARLAALADATGATVLLLRHLNKAKGADPLYRGGGSIGIVGAARAAMLVAPDPDDPDRRVLAWSKSNLAPTPDSLAYRLIDTEPLHVAQVVWDGVSGHTARSLLVGADGDDSAYSAASEAETWLGDYLTIEGPCAASSDVKAAAAKVGISERTLQRAAKKLGVVITKRGFPAVTEWSLPAQSRQSRQCFELGATGATEDIRVAVGATGPPGFTPPSGPGRCDECGFHTETQGHRDTCSKHDEDDEPPF
jgi:hypothetical protein